MAVGRAGEQHLGSPAQQGVRSRNCRFGPYGNVRISGRRHRRPDARFGRAGEWTIVDEGRPKGRRPIGQDSMAAVVSPGAVYRTIGRLRTDSRHVGAGILDDERVSGQNIRSDKGVFGRGACTLNIGRRSGCRKTDGTLKAKRYDAPHILPARDHVIVGRGSVGSIMLVRTANETGRDENAIVGTSVKIRT